MLEQLLSYLHNWFRVRDKDDGKHPGTYAIKGGDIALPFLLSGQYFRIIGSALNDGLHRYGDGGLTDETFDGTIWALAIPQAVLSLASDVEAWQARYADVVASPYSSESFVDYSYTKGSSGGAVGGGISGWQDAFRARLSPWRKLRED